MTLILRRQPELRRLNQMFDAALNGFPFGTDGTLAEANAWFPPTDVVEDADGVRISVELPGIKPENVDVAVENRVLSIKGEKTQASEQSSSRLHRYERSYGRFERTFHLPETVDADRIQAQYEHGVLTLTLPRAEQAKPRKIEVALR